MRGRARGRFDVGATGNWRFRAWVANRHAGKKRLERRESGEQCEPRALRERFAFEHGGSDPKVASAASLFIRVGSFADVATNCLLIRAPVHARMGSTMVLHRKTFARSTRERPAARRPHSRCASSGRTRRSNPWDRSALRVERVPPPPACPVPLPRKHRAFGLAEGCLP